MNSYKEHKNDHDFFSEEHIKNFLRQHKTGIDNLGRQRLGHIVGYHGNNASVLDIACGSAVNYECWRNLGYNFQYTGFDLTQKLLDEAKRRYGDEIRLVRGYAQELDQHFKEQSFCICVIRHFCEHLPEGKCEDIIKQALDIAKHEVLVVFFLTPHSGVDHILEERSSNIEGHPEVTHWWNNYSWKELTKFFSTLGVQIKTEGPIYTPGAAHSDFIVRLIK